MTRRLIALAVAAVVLACAAPASADIAAIGVAGYATAFGDVECPFSVATVDGVPGSGAWWYTAEAGPSLPFPDGCELWGVEVDGLAPGDYHLSVRHGVLVGGAWRWATHQVPHGSPVSRSGTNGAWAGAPTRMDVRVCPVGGSCTAWATVLDSATM